MGCWVVSDNQDLIDKVSLALQRLNLRCQETHRVSLAEAARSSHFLESADGVAFIAMPTVSDDDVALIRRIRSLSRVHLVLVSAADNTSVVNALRAGVSDYLDIEHDLATEISCCLSRIKRADAELKPKSFTISIVPCHVASDGSVLAANLAAAIAKKHQTCCLLDLQLRGGDLALLLKLQPQHSIYDLISQPQAVDEGMFRQALAAHESGVQLLAGPTLFSDLRGIDPHSCNAIVDNAQAMFPYVVIAAEDIQHSEQIYALAHSDRVVLTMRPDLMSLHRAKQHVDFMLSHDINDDHIQVVVVGTGLPGELPMTAIKKVLNRTAVHGLPDDATGVMLSINVGNPIVLESPKSAIAREIQKLTAHLTGQDGEKTPRKTDHLLSAKAAALLALNTLTFCK